MRFSLQLKLDPDPRLTAFLLENPGRFAHFYIKGGLEPESQKLTELTQKLKPLKADLVYSLPYPCCGGEECTPQFQQKLINLLTLLGKLGVTALQVENPYFIELLRSPFPPYNRFNHFKIYLGPGARITNRSKLRYLKALELTLTTLHPTLNRAEKSFSEISRPLAGGVEAAANSGCFTSCALEHFCSALSYHEAEEKLPKKAREPYLEFCDNSLAQDPWRVLTLPLIPPEEIENHPADYFYLLTPPDDPERTLLILNSYLNAKSPEDLSLLTVKPGGAKVGLPIPRKIALKNYRRLVNCGGECPTCPECRNLYQESQKLASA